MSNWREEEQPRDEDGKFTYKNGGQQSREEKLQNRADILFDSEDNKQKQSNSKSELLLGGISKEINQETIKSNSSDFLPNLANESKNKINHIKNQVAVDNIDDPVLKKIADKLYGTETAENLLMSKKDYYLNTEYAKEHLIFKNYKELSPDLRDYFKKKITEQIGADKLDETGGIYINAEHKSSKDMAQALIHNTEFINNVAKNKKLLNLGKSVDSSIQFVDKNFYHAIGKADIKNMHINKNGDLDFLIADVYDFNDDKNASDLIKVGRNRQEKGEIIPYFYIYHVIIPKNATLHRELNANYKK